METIDRLKQILLVYRTEDISKLTFEERMEYDNAFAEEIVKLFPIHNVSGSVCDRHDFVFKRLGTIGRKVMKCKKCGFIAN